MKRISLREYEVGLSNLIKKAKTLFKNDQYIATVPGIQLCFLYQDIEGDWITIRNDTELYDCIIEQKET